MHFRRIIFGAVAIFGAGASSPTGLVPRAPSRRAACEGGTVAGKGRSERSEWVRRVANRLRRLPKSAEERAAHALPVAKARFLRGCFHGAPPLFHARPAA